MSMDGREDQEGMDGVALFRALAARAGDTQPEYPLPDLRLRVWTEINRRREERVLRPMNWAALACGAAAMFFFALSASWMYSLAYSLSWNSTLLTWVGY